MRVSSGRTTSRVRMLSGRLILGITLGVVLGGCGETAGPPDATPEDKGSLAHIRRITTAVDDAALRDADARPGDWLTYGRNYREDRYSPLDQVHRGNVAELGLAWTLDLGTKRGIQATPLVVDGIMFLSGPWSVVYAIDARKGELIWEYDPGVDRGIGTRLCCGVSNRGLALYKGAVFVGTLDGRLISIDAADGTPNWEVMTVDPGGYQSITGAPRIAEGLVLIGNGGAEFTARGYVSAYRADTGELAWRFYTVPGNPDDGFEHPDLEQAAATWTGSWWELGGGGTAWDSIAYDPELGRVYIGVGNGTPWNRLRRSPGGGDNLYFSSIVAVDASTGRYLWHFQTTPGDTWDYTATQHILQADLTVDGATRKVLVQAPKNGFFYVLDRATGAFVSGAPFVYMNWATGLDPNGRPVEREGARYEDGRKHRIAPSPHGGHNWQPMSYDPETGWVYLPAVEQIGSLRYDRSVPDRSRRRLNGGNGATNANNLSLYVEEVQDDDPRAPKPGESYGRLIAWDPVAQELRWEVRQPLFYNGGLLTTAGGLLLQGDAEGWFRARDTRTGDGLWEFDLRSGAVAPPVTYLVDGEQYVTIAVGWGGGPGKRIKRVDRIHPGTVYTFRLGGDAQPPEKLPPLERTVVALTTDASPLDIGIGYNLYMGHCVHCHGSVGGDGGEIPALAWSTEGMYALLHEIVLDGLLLSEGMPSFEDKLTREEVDLIEAYLLHEAEGLRAGTPAEERRRFLADAQRLADKA